jgi:protein-S-isoprenylcysteine O-methyltransferase Ste14
VRERLLRFWSRAPRSQHDGGGSSPRAFGTYRFVRHPISPSKIAVIGVFIQFAFLRTAILFLANIAVQLRRMQNEELALAASLPEYVAYRRNTARLIPGIR